MLSVMAFSVFNPIAIIVILVVNYFIAIRLNLTKNFIKYVPINKPHDLERVIYLGSGN